MNSTNAVDVNIHAVSPEFNSSAETPEESNIKKGRRRFFFIMSPVYKASSFISPVLIRTTCSNEDTNIFPSPIFPVFDT